MQCIDGETGPLNGWLFVSRSLAVQIGRDTVWTDWAICAKKLASIRTDRAIRSKKSASVWTAGAIRSKKLASVRMARAIRSKKFVGHLNGSSYSFKKSWQPLERFELSCSKKFVNRSSYLLEKNKTVTSSFHWKVKCCEWSLCRDVFMSFRKYCRGMSQLRSTQLFTRAKTFHRVEYSWLLTATASHHD